MVTHSRLVGELMASGEANKLDTVGYSFKMKSLRKNDSDATGRTAYFLVYTREILAGMTHLWTPALASS